MIFKPTRPSFKYISLIIVLGLLAFTGLSTMLDGNRVLASPSEGARVMLVAPDEVHVGELIQVDLVATNVQNLAGFQGRVRVDPDYLRITGAHIDDDLTRSGRDILPLGPVLDSHVVMIGAATCPVQDCYNSSLKSIKRAVNGVDGEVKLATIELHASSPGTYELRLDEDGGGLGDETPVSYEL